MDPLYRYVIMSDDMMVYVPVQRTLCKATMWTEATDPWLGPIACANLRIGRWETAIMAAGTGPPVLLLHGASVAVDSRLTWFRLFGILARTHRTIMFDQPGFGASEIPHDRLYPDRLERSEHALAVIDRLELDGLSVVGHSEGGFLALRVALGRPGRVRQVVVATSGGAAPKLGDGRDAAWMQASAEIYDYPARTVDQDTFVRTELALRRRADPEFESLLRANFRRDLGSGSVEMFRRRAAASGRFARYTDLQERHLHPSLPQLQARATLLWADRDPTVPVERGAMLARMIPEASLHVLPETGHWLMHDQPDLFARLVAQALLAA